MVYRRLSCSTALGGCRRCLKLPAGRDVDEVHRLRVLHALLRPRFAAQIRRLTFTDTNSFCVCDKPRMVGASPHSNGFAKLYVETVTALLPRADNLRALRSDSLIQKRLCIADGHRLQIRRSTSSLDEFVQCLQPTNLQLTICRKTYHNGLGRLRHLTLDSSKLHSPASLPQMAHLCSLEVQVHGADTSHLTSRRPLVDLSLFARLARLHIIGDMWIGIQQQFTGSCDTIRTCILQGPMVLGRRSGDFFARIQAGLRYLYCRGTHMISEVEITLPQLEFLALHDTIHGAGVFPFPGSSIRAVSLEVGDSYGPYQLEDHNAILRLVLENTRDTLQLLALRSGSVWAPGDDEVHALQSMPLLTALILDGALVFGRKAWSRIRRLSRLKLIATIDTWTRAAVSASPSTPVEACVLTAQQAISPWAPKLSSVDRHPGEICGWGEPPEVCDCGLLDRKSAFRSVGMQDACFEVYSWLIADPRTSSCAHDDVSKEETWRPWTFGDKACE